MRLTTFLVGILGVPLFGCGSTGRDCSEEGACANGSGGSMGLGGYPASGGGGGGNYGPTLFPPDGPFPSVTEAAAACEQPGEVTDLVWNPDDMKSWLTRRWVYCSGSNLFEQPHAGLTFESDGFWYFLDLVDGELVPRAGFSGGGEWDVMDGGYGAQVNINSFKGYGSGGNVRFAVSPLKMSLSMLYEDPPEYVAVSPAAF